MKGVGGNAGLGWRIVKWSFFDCHLIRVSGSYDRRPILSHVTTSYQEGGGKASSILTVQDDYHDDHQPGRGLAETLLSPTRLVRATETISSVLHACDAKIAVRERESVLLDELFRVLLEELMTGRVAMAGVG